MQAADSRLADDPSSLRERRRRQTSRDIQLATLRLAEQRGYEAVTTEMIAAAAGISPRTFFNYFPNKEAAAIGDPPVLRRSAIERFVAGHGELLADFEALLSSHLHETEPEIVRAVIGLAHGTPRLMVAHLQSLQALHTQLCEILARRSPDIDRDVVSVVAEIAVSVVRRSVLYWVDNPGMDARTAFASTALHLRAAMNLLGAPGAALPEGAAD